VPTQGLGRRAGRARGRAPSRAQLRPHDRSRARSCDRVHALRPRRSGLPGDRRRSAPGASLRHRRRRDDDQAGAHARDARASGPGSIDRRRADRLGDGARQEGKGRTRSIRAGASHRRFSNRLRRPHHRNPRGHRLPRVVMSEAGLTTETCGPYNSHGMSGEDQAIVGAIRRQEERLARDPASLAFAQLADLYRKAGRTREAVALCRNGLARYPHYTTARLILAKTLAAEGALDAALAEIGAILELSPKDVQCHRLAAEIQRRLGHIDRAVTHLEAAVRLDPGDRESRSLLGLLRATTTAAGEASGLQRVL